MSCPSLCCLLCNCPKTVNFLQVPNGEVLSFADDKFIEFETAGVKEAQNAAFVLVAGGLGERLGYNGIKVDNRKTDFVYAVNFLYLVS